MPSYLIYGQDNYRAKKKLDQIKEKYISASLGDTNLKIIDEEASFDQISREILAMPFLAKSRLVIIRNLLKKGKKSANRGPASSGDIQTKVAEFLPKIPSSTVVFFFEEEMPDKRIALFKKLNSPGKAQEFKLLEEDQIRRWIRKEVENRKGTIEPEAITLLAEYVGPDLWRLSNELDKLTNYNLELSTETIKLLVAPEIKSDIFKMIDAIGEKNFQKALREYEKLIESGQNELYILSMIVYQFRNLLIVKDLVERSRKPLSRWDIAKKAGMHPYVAQKTLWQTKNFTIEKLKKIYKILLDFDLAIKTGKMEGKVALVLIIAKFCM